MLVTGFVPDFQKNHLSFGKGSGRSTCFHEAGSYYKVQVEESKAQSATLTSARQRREDTTGKVRGEKKGTTVMQVVVL